MSYLLINGRSAVHKGSNGKVMTVDVCLTQIGNSVPPIPYLNVAESKDADKTADSVTVDGNPACNQDSTFAKSRGDEPGNKKGIRSRKKGAEATFIMGSPTVGIIGRPAVRALELMVSNARNTPPSALLQAVGMPPLAQSTSSPEALEALVGPYHNAVSHQMPEGLHPKNFIGDLTAPEGPAIREVAVPTSSGLSKLEGIQPENSALALGVREATPWPHKAEGYLLLPLGEYDHIPSEEALTEGVANLAYFKLQRYLTPDNDVAQVEALRPGWVYVFVNGYLWRELEVNENGTFSDVDLRTWQGCDGGLDHEGRPIGRRATGTSQNYLELPYEIHGETPEVQVAFSEVQWSWKRIASLGGMDPEDPRMRHLVRENETLSGIVQCYPTVKDSQQLADLNGLASPDAIQVDQVLTVREADQPPSDAATLRQERMGAPIDLDAAIGEQFTLTLEDPLGVADLLANTMTGLMLTHQQVIGSLNGEHMMDTAEDIDNARISDYFWYSRHPDQEGKVVFPPEPPLRREGENWRKHCQHLTEIAMMVYPTLMDPDALAKLDEDTRGKLETAAGELDADLLKEWLQVEERRAIRNDIRQVREALTDILWEKTQQTVRMQRVIEDFALQPTPLYLNLWVRVNDLLNKIIVDPCNLDQQYDLPSEVENERSADAMSGQDFLITLLKPEGDAVLESLHHCLYPTTDQVNIGSEEAPDLDKMPDPSLENPFATGFRPKDFAESIEQADKEASTIAVTRKESGKVFDVIDKSLGLGASLQERLPAEKVVTLTLEPIFRLVKGAKIPILENMRLVLKGEDMTGLVAPGTYRIQKMYDVEHQQRLDRNTRTQLAVDESQMQSHGLITPTNIVNAEGRVLGSSWISENSPYKGLPNPDIDKTDAKQLFATYGKTGTGEQLVRARMTFVAVPEERYRQVVQRLDDFHKGLKENIAYRSLPTGLLLLEVVNVWYQLDEKLRRDDSTDVNKVGYIAGSVVKLSAAGVAAIEAWMGGEEAYVESLKNSSKRWVQAGATPIPVTLGRRGVKYFPAYKFLGIAGIAIDILYTSKDTFTAIRRNDYDAATAMAISSLLSVSGGVLLTIGILPVIGWALFIGGILSYFVASWLTDDPLESWAKNSPFSAEADNRLAGTDKYDNAMDTGEKALRQLQNLLIAPSIKHLKKSEVHDQTGENHWVEVEVVLPAYHMDTSEVYMRMDVRLEKNAIEPAVNLTPASVVARMNGMQDLRPTEIEVVPATNGNPHRLKVFFKRPQLSNKFDAYLWNFRMQHHLNANLRLPLPDPNDADKPDNGWLTTDGVTRA